MPNLCEMPPAHRHALGPPRDRVSGGVRLTIRDAAIATLKATAMVMWIFFGATMFVGFFILKGGQTFVAESILGTGLPAYGVLLLMMVILFVLGMFLDWVGILLLTVPIFVPILT